MALFILGKARGYKNRRRIPDQRSHSAALIDIENTTSHTYPTIELVTDVKIYQMSRLELQVAGF